MRSYSPYCAFNLLCARKPKRPQSCPTQFHSPSRHGGVTSADLRSRGFFPMRSSVMSGHLFFRPYRTRRLRSRQRHRCAATPAHRHCHSDLPVRRRNSAQGQPRLGSAHPPERYELDGRGTRHRAFRTHGPREARRCSSVSCNPIVGRAAEIRGGNNAGLAHHPGATLPEVERPGVRLKIIAGTAFGAHSPVKVHSGTLYAHANLADGASLTLSADHAERAVYVVNVP